MPITLTLPALSPTMDEGTLARWLVREGETIAAGDIIAEIETEKATMEFESPKAGVLARILVPGGSEGVAVNTPVAVLAAEGEDAATVAAAGAIAAPVQATAVASAATSSPGSWTAASVALRRQAASPLARWIARHERLDLAGLSGSGPNGRIIRADVEAALAAASAAAPVATASPTPAETATPPPAAVLADSYSPGSYEEVVLDGMRRTIARRLTESKQTVPHFYLRLDIALDAAIDLRARLNASAPVRNGVGPIWKISLNDMMIKALAAALRDVPEANVTWTEGRMFRHRPVDVAVAVAIDGGLVTPVIRDAEAKSLSAISNEIKALVARARARKLAPEEYRGGTTSLSNLGMFGISSFDAVINPPHGTILAVGAAERRVVVRGEAMAIATMITVTVSVDHRAIDGALAARLLTAFRSHLENPLALLV